MRCGNKFQQGQGVEPRMGLEAKHLLNEGSIANSTEPSFAHTLGYGSHAGC